LSKEEIERIIAEAETYKAADAGIAKKITAKNDLEGYTYQVRNTLDDPQFKEHIKSEERTKVEKAIKVVTDWLEKSPNAELEEYEQKKKELEEVWKPIITKIYGQTGQAGGNPSDGASGMPNFGNPGGDSSGPKIDEVD